MLWAQLGQSVEQRCAKIDKYLRDKHTHTPFPQGCRIKRSSWLTASPSFPRIPSISTPSPFTHTLPGPLPHSSQPRSASQPNVVGRVCQEDTPAFDIDRPTACLTSLCCATLRKKRLHKKKFHTSR